MISLSLRYPFRAVRRSLAVVEVLDLFGVCEDPGEHVIAENLRLEIHPGDVVFFGGISGSGKSSLLREAGRQLGAVDAMALELPEVPLIDAVCGTVAERLSLLAACGLSEARLLVRTPSELSDGQRYRFRLALAVSKMTGGFLMADEFCAYLDRTLAKVVSYNLRKLATRLGIGCLVATTHDDIIADLRPDLHVTCLGDGRFETNRDPGCRTPAPVSFHRELTVCEGTPRDWDAFAKWHYRSHCIGFVKRVVLLKHGPTPVAVCVFCTPAASLSLRSRFFGLKGRRTKQSMRALNEQLWLLSRVVIHPTYRGAGLAAGFLREACATCPVDWIETLSAMGHANPVFEKAGFTRVGVIRKDLSPTRDGQYGSKQVHLIDETRRQSEWSEPVYYVRDNRVDAARMTF
jgi:ABC-type ATPase with predicted acetyltransferase domain